MTTVTTRNTYKLLPEPTSLSNLLDSKTQKAQESIMNVDLLLNVKCGHVFGLFWLSKLILQTLSQPRTCAKRNKAQITGEVLCSIII